MGRPKKTEAKIINPTIKLNVQLSQYAWDKLTKINVDGKDCEKLPSASDLVELLQNTGTVGSEHVYLVSAKMKDGETHTFLTLDEGETLTELNDENDVGTIVDVLAKDLSYLISGLQTGVFAVA